MYKTKECIFWDNDGVLVDTEKYYFEATRQIMKQAGFDLTLALYKEFFLELGTGAWHLLDSQIYTPEKIKQLKLQRNDLYLDYLLNEDIAVEHIEAVVAKLSAKYKMAIVTSSYPDHFYAIHKRTGLLRYFNFVITSNDYSNYKPHPEPYLVAIQQMGTTAAKSIAIEDSRRGLIAATKAGLDCIVIKSDLTGSSDFSEAKTIISSIQELTELL